MSRRLHQRGYFTAACMGLCLVIALVILLFR
ncbi:hypothetical protein AB7M47_003858 [Bradyrhizobium elkanii]